MNRHYCPERILNNSSFIRVTGIMHRPSLIFTSSKLRYGTIMYCKKCQSLTHRTDIPLTFLKLLLSKKMKS
jgi:hypothetical protein